MRTTESGTRRSWHHFLLLGLLIATGGTLVALRLRPPKPLSIDTRLAGGTHLSLVFIAPTSIPNDSLNAAIRASIDHARQIATSQGWQFSTVGVSDDWSTNRGLRLLEGSGPFDELIVGRNLLNSGMARYVSQMHAREAVPQLLLQTQLVVLDPLPATYGAPKELIRLLGARSILDWWLAGFPMASN